MAEDIRTSGSPGSVLPGDTALAGSSPAPSPASPWDIDTDWWGPAWDTVTATGRLEPGLSGHDRSSGTRSGSRRPATAPPQPAAPAKARPRPAVTAKDLAPPAAAAKDQARPGAQPSSPASSPDPSWRQTLATTVSLWRSRRRPAASPAGTAAAAADAAPPVRSRARLRLVSVAVLGLGVLAAGAGAAGLVVANGSPASAARLPSQPSPVAAPTGQTVTQTWQAADLPVPKPVELTIPSIGVKAPITTLGLNRDGTLQVPASTTVTGWYTNSPSPGATGAAVIAGHVDSRTGPGVFFWLRNMRPGDKIYVQRADKTLAVFTVTGVQTYAKNHFPTASVYGAVPDAELRLITCGGTFDSAKGSYLSNVVVYARLSS